MRGLVVLVTMMGVLGVSASGQQQTAPQPGRQGGLMDPTHNMTTADVPGLTAAASTCGLSDDATYGTTPANPIKVGGGALYLASREVKYLSALRGPTGEGLHFVRTHSLPPEPDDTILDAYNVSYPGLDKPRVLYLDGYHWDQPLAPKDWLCGAPMNLNPPGPDPFKTTRALAQLAIDQRDAYADPISLDPDGLHAHGVVFDFPRLVAAYARAAAASGPVFDGGHLPAALSRQHTVIVATPSDCAGQPAKAVDIVLADARGNRPPASGKANSPKDIAALTGGYLAPDGSMAVLYDVVGLIVGATVTVRYDACGGTAATLPFAVKSAPPRIVTSVVATAPAGATVSATGETVQLQLFVLPDGSPHLPEYASGAYQFRDAAIEAVQQWTFTPFLINGAPILRPETVGVLVK